MRRSTRIKSKVEVGHGNSQLQSEQIAKKDLSQSAFNAPPDQTNLSDADEKLTSLNDLIEDTLSHQVQSCLKNSSDEENSTELKSNSISTKKSKAKKKTTIQIKKSSKKSEKLKQKSLNFIETDPSSEKEIYKADCLNSSPVTFIPIVSTQVKTTESINQLELNENDILVDIIPLVIEKPLEFTKEKLTKSKEREILESEGLQSENLKDSVKLESKFQSSFNQSPNLSNKKINFEQTLNALEEKNVILSISELNDSQSKNGLNSNKSCENFENNNETSLKINKKIQDDICLKPIIVAENCSQSAELALLNDSPKKSQKKYVSLNPLNYVQINIDNNSDLSKDAAGFKVNSFLKNLLHNPTKSHLPHEKMDVCGLDRVLLDPAPDTLSKGLTSSIQYSIGVSSSNFYSGLTSEKKQKNGVEAVMEKSVLTSDLEKRVCAPKMFESKHSKQVKRKKIAEETAGKGWYNLPKTEVTEEIKRDLQIIKMRGVLDGKHHYKRNDSNKLPKYFQIGTIVEGAHEFYNSRVPNKKRKATIVDELLNDAEFRRKNKKNFLQLQKKKMSGGKKYYKQKINKSKPTWART
ncbi:deoxynucleotidyltransferase terminal-interacting protein 2 isoform X1 [Hydra vulgaris]|uniref:deoxynucleotidyltransferase terminal-interacting protein 2 isoform X1 n=1 Tax=Hydra vulgaris TaxID=6087 RepID=UPI001F5FF1A6|nr:deoxynucleotidyltransferase terminal-interacting protein 2 [Hydra vulgaris]